MAPTITVGKQKYTHVSRVVIRTTAVYKIIEARHFGILLGYEKDDIIYIENVYFPEEQEPNGNFLSTEVIGNHRAVF